MLRRSDFIAATYALSLVFANFGIAIAARIPMMTTTIKSSMRVKPFLFCVIYMNSSVLVDRDAPPTDAEQWRMLYRRTGVLKAVSAQLARDEMRFLRAQASIR